MRPLTSWIKVIGLCCALWPLVSQADEIILNTGERFTSNKIWKENGKIRFNMHGLVVSVNPDDVVTILRSDQTSPLSSTKETVIPPSAQPPPIIKEKPRNQKKIKPSPKRKSTPKNPLESSSKTLKIRGIGIDGIEWQMQPSSIPGIEKGKTEPIYGGIDQYHRTEGNLRMGDALLDGLVFGFWQNRLYTITIWVDGKPAYQRLQGAVFHRYGEGQKNKTGLERYVWIEDTTDRMLEFDENLNTGILWMRSRELDQYLKNRYPD